MPDLTPDRVGQIKLRALYGASSRFEGSAVPATGYLIVEVAFISWRRAF